MAAALYFWTCILAISLTDATKEIPETSLGPYDSPDSGSDNKIKFVKYGSISRSSLEDYSYLTFNEHQQQLGIIGGDPTDITAHPFQVAIDKGKIFVCAGALLNRIWVVALASCTAGAKTTDLTIRVGSNSNVYGGTVFNVTDIVVHPNYNYATMDYDFSLVKLNTYLCFDKDVNKIDFSLTPPKNKYTGVISGWGTDGNKPKNLFRQLTMHVIYNSWCQKDYDVTHDVITDRMFCALAGRKGPCFNDFGDPFVVNGTLYGLYSWSRGCAEPNYPAVFASLSSVQDWIHQVMNNACTCGVF